MSWRRCCPRCSPRCSRRRPGRPRGPGLRAIGSTPGVLSCPRSSLPPASVLRSSSSPHYRASVRGRSTVDSAFNRSYAEGGREFQKVTSGGLLTEFDSLSKSLVAKAPGGPARLPFGSSTGGIGLSSVFSHQQGFARAAREQRTRMRGCSRKMTFRHVIDSLSVIGARHGQAAFLSRGCLARTVSP